MSNVYLGLTLEEVGVLRDALKSKYGWPQCRHLSHNDRQIAGRLLEQMDEYIRLAQEPGDAEAEARDAMPPNPMK